MNPIVKVIILNTFWYAAVYFGPQGFSSEIIIFILGIVLAAFNFRQASQQISFKNYTLLLVAFFIYGFIQDFLLGYFGFIQYQQSYPPFWLLSMYAAFLCYYNDLFLKFRKMPIFIQILFGAIGGPLAYVGGAAIANLQIPPESKTMYIILVANSWAIFFPLSLKGYQKLERS